MTCRVALESQTALIEGLLDLEALETVLARCRASSTKRLVLRAGTEVRAECIATLAGLDEEEGYRPTLGFPVARLSLPWRSLDGYLNALKSKKRLDVRRRRAALEAPGITVEVIEDYAPHAERLAALWEQVARRHGEYEHERLTPAYFAAMAQHLRGRSHVIAIKRYGTIIAFGLGLIGDHDYFGVAERQVAPCSESG